METITIITDYSTTTGAFAPSQYIPSMQSFFIQNAVGVSTPVLTFENSFRNVTSAALNANFYKQKKIQIMANQALHCKDIIMITM